MSNITNHNEATDFDREMMQRALTLARCGAGRVSPNPMVGAVITHGRRIIGEGYHRQWGGPHAEVNAVRSVREGDRPLLPESTIYVTLEPCAHYGKTPPCAELLVREHVKRVVIGSVDPFARVCGRGVAMLREAGIEVATGVLEEQCLRLNRRFMTAHSLHRPYIQLKWAQSADGYMARSDGSAVRLSTPVTRALMHRERSLADAIMVGTDTANRDNPRLDVRHWYGREPLRVTFNRHGRLRDNLLLHRDDNYVVISREEPLADTVAALYRDHGVISLMVEGGPNLLKSFIAEGLYDEVRVETSPLLLGEGREAPDLRNIRFEEIRSQKIENQTIIHYFRTPVFLLKKV